jgi:Ca2+-binding EF-hand superfamily protein
MSSQTKLELAEVIRGMLKCEGYTDELRTNLNKREYFSISAAFTTIDINENSFITSDELKAFLEEYEYFATQREIQLIFDKFDRDRDGKISYNEFFQELTPKAASEK